MPTVSRISVIIATISAFVNLIETRRNMKRLREMARHEDEIDVIRDGRTHTIPTRALVPGGRAR